MELPSAETIVALVALAWLLVASFLMARSVRRGQALADMLAIRHPQIYEELGRPRPTYFDSPRRDRFARYVGCREFLGLGDAHLEAEFERHKQSEARLVVLLIASLLAVGALVLAVRRLS